MARGKKKKKVGARRRRRMGAKPGLLMEAGMTFLGAGIGAVAGVFINQAVKTSFTTMPSYTGGAVNVLAGFGGLAFGGDSAFVRGAAVGLMGIGAVLVTNETFLSLPGISGIPMGVPNARAIPGNYLSSSVAGYRGINRNPGMGNMSGNGSRAVGAMYRN